MIPWFGQWRLEKQRQQLLKNCPEGPLKEFYKAGFQSQRLPIRDAEIVVLDFETTGLDIRKDHIISIGLVEIHQLGIRLNSSWHQVVKTSHNMPAGTAIIHQITDDMVADGELMHQAMVELLSRLAGKILLAHHASIELGFLNKVTTALYGQRFICPTIDTFVLGQRQLNRQQWLQQSGALRLYNLRKIYGLPVYKAHNAFYDALSTAELFLALLNDLYPQLDCKVNDLVSEPFKS